MLPFLYPLATPSMIVWLLRTILTRLAVPCGKNRLAVLPLFKTKVAKELKPVVPETEVVVMLVVLPFTLICVAVRPSITMRLVGIFKAATLTGLGMTGLASALRL